MSVLSILIVLSDSEGSPTPPVHLIEGFATELVAGRVLTNTASLPTRGRH